ncbi:hypothetical protein GC197_12550 [bacterium]|nr:hypothetical protein [bacterium]
MHRSGTSAATVIGVVLVTAMIGHADESIADRTIQIESLSAAEKSELQLKLERFENLPSDERKRRITLNEAIDQHPDGKELRAVMHHYYDWLKTISSVERLKLQDLSPEERIIEIKHIMANQERKQFEEFTRDEFRDLFRDIKPTPKDFQVIHEWLDDWLEKHNDEIIALEPKLYQRVPWLKDRLEDAPPYRKRFVIWVWSIRDPEVSIAPSDEDFKQLASKLDKQTQKKLEAETPERRKGLLGALMRAAVYSHFQSRVNDEELQQFYRKLPEDRQAELAAMPPERFDAELRRDYMRANGTRFFGGGRPPGPPWGNRDGRRGDDRGERGPDGRGPNRGGDRGNQGAPNFRDGLGPRQPDMDGGPSFRRAPGVGPPMPKDEGVPQTPVDE